MLRLLLFAFALSFAAPASAQHRSVPSDTVITWRTYARAVEVPIQVFTAESDRRPYTIVLDDRAEYGALLTTDARFFAETVGRGLGVDPAEATFVFRYSAASFSEGEDPGRRALLVRATFSRNRSGTLAAPTWRLITRDELSDLTDRAM